MGERARTAVLVVCLLLLSAVLAALSGSVVQPGAVATTQKVPALGTLLVKVVTEQDFSSPPVASPIAGANVSISRISSGLHIPLVFQTNSSGELAISLVVGPYAVSVSDAQFQNATDAVVRANMTTEVDASVTRDIYPTLFSDLPDPDSAASVAPWSYLTVAVNSSLGLPLKDPLFIDGFYGTYVTLITSAGTSEGGNQSRGPGQSLTVVINSLTGLSESRAELISSNLDSSVSPGVLWLTLQPGSFISLSGLVALTLSTYPSELQVTIHAT